MIKIGIVGTGRTFGIAHYHAMGILHDSRGIISAVYNTHEDNARKWLSEHNLDAKVCTSYQQLLDDVDAVIICTPNYAHYELVKEAIEKDKHILVEKPLSLTIEESRLLGKSAESFGKTNMIGFVNRYAKATQAARELVNERMGKIFSITSWYGGKRLADPSIPCEWRMKKSLAGTGALGDFGSHLIDLADYIAKQRYETIQCMTGQTIPIRQNGAVENDDVAMFIAKGENGMGSFTLSRTGLDDIMVLISGEGGLIQLSLRKPASIVFWEKEITGGYTGKSERREFPEQNPFEACFDIQIRTFLDAIEGKQIEYPTLKQGTYVQEVLHAAENSASTGKAEQISIIR